MSNTKTETNTKVDIKTNQEETVIVVEAPLFIIFAEYLGYVSIFNKLAEDWCNSKVPMPHIQKILIMEAKCILRQMKKDYTADEIREFYYLYYPLILQEYDENLNKMLSSDK